jgi:riboflavin synthase
MFTGLVETMGTVVRVQTAGAGKTLVISVPLAKELLIGESVAVNGACLTVVGRDETNFQLEAGPETLAKTNLGDLTTGGRVNLERALRVGDRLGGHFVQGHVDGVGAIVGRILQGEWETIWFGSPPALITQMVPKGSVAVDGVSLTLVDVLADRFSVALIPHTLANTTLGFKQPGDKVNLETDLLAKYVHKCVGRERVTRETLLAAGFLREQDDTAT